MGCTVKRNDEGKIVDVYIAGYQLGESNGDLETIITSLISRLEDTNLASKVRYINNRDFTQEEIDSFKSVKGLVKDNIVYLNKDKMTLDTPIHEFGHLWINWVKNNRKDLYERGMNLVKEQGQDYLNKIQLSQPNLEGDTLVEEALAEIIGDKGAEIVGTLNPEARDSIFMWLNDLWASVKKLIGLSKYKNVENLTLDEYAKAVAIDLVGGKKIEDFTIPYTISPLLDQMLLNKKGKQVSVQTIKQIMNQPATKNIEKDIINEVLELPMFKGKSKIDFDSFVLEVNNRILPLSVKKSKSYSDYGMENTGVEPDTTYTNLYNTNLEHGITGHFNSDFDVVDSVNLEVVPLGNNFAVVFKGVDLTAENIQDNVVTVTTTEEQAEEYISLVQNNEQTNKGMFGHTRVWEADDHVYVAEIQSDSFQKMKAEEMLMESYKNNPRTMNKAQKELMKEVIINQDVVKEFGRKFNPIEDMYDYLFSQIKYAKENISKENIREESREISKNHLVDLNDELKASNDLLEGKVTIYETGTEEELAKNNLEFYHKFPFGFTIFKNRESDFITVENTHTGTRYTEQNLTDSTEVFKKEFTKLYGNIEDFGTNYTTLFNAKKNIESLNKKIIDLASIEDKQFIASRKNYTQRLLREEIRRGASKGRNSLSIPTPRTLALIEGYISDDGSLPYEITEAENEERLDAGDRIDMGGTDYLVVDSNYTEIDVLPYDELKMSSNNAWLNEYVSSSTSETYDEIMEAIPATILSEEEWDTFRGENYVIEDKELSEVAEEIEDGMFEISPSKLEEAIKEYYEGIYRDEEQYLEELGYTQIYNIDGDNYFTNGNVSLEHFLQPDGYDVDSAIEDFNVEDLDTGQQTVLKKYETLISDFKKMRPDAEIFTDNKGNEWWRTNLTQDDAEAPIIVFQKERPSSQLYEKIVSNPFLTTEQSLSVYKNVFSKKFKDEFGDWENSPSNDLTYETGEPKLFYLSPSGVLTESYKEALLSTDTGLIQMGFVSTEDILNTQDSEMFNIVNNDLVIYKNQYKLNNKKAFTNLTKIDSNSNPETLNGFINHNIRKGILSENKVKVGDDYLFKGEGNLDSLSEFNSKLVLAEAITYLGSDSVKAYQDGTIELSQIDTNSVDLVSSNGIVKMTKEKIKDELNNGRFDFLNKNHYGFLDTLYRIFKQDNELYGKATTNNTVEVKDKDLRLTLLNTLNKIGVNVVSITDYLENYNVRNNIDPSVGALADIANNVMAFAEGKATLENITEETAHFIIEGFNNQDLINEILPQVVGTTQWLENYENYYDKYSEQAQGQELDNLVRREILGKILRDKIIDNFNNQETTPTESSLFTQLKNLWEQFLANIRNLFTSNLRKDLDTVLDELSNKVMDEEIHNYFDTDLLKNSKFTMFSLNDKKALITLSKAKQQLEKRLLALKQSSDVTSVKVQQEITKLGQAIETADEWLGVRTIISAVDPQVKYLKKQLEEYKELNSKDDSKIAYFTQEEKGMFNSLSIDFLPILKELREIVNSEMTPMEGINVESISNQMKELIDEIGIIEGKVKVQIIQDRNAIVNRIIDEYGLSDDQREKLEKLIENDFKETSWFQKNFGALEHASNPFLNILGKIISTNNNRANVALLKDMNPFLKKVDSEEWSLNDWKDIIEMDNGVNSGFTKSPYKWAEFYNEEKKAETEAYNKTFNTTLNTEQYLYNLKNGKLKRKADYTREETQIFTLEMSKWYNENTERRYNNDFYENKEKIYTDLGISEDTKEFLQNLSIRRYQILSKYIEPNVDLDYTKITSRDRQQLALLTQERKSAKSTFNAESGLLKTGSEANISEDLKNLDKYFQDNKKEFVIKDSFLDTIKNIEANNGAREAFDWLKLNGGIIFNDNFWGGLGENKTTLIEKLNMIKEEIREENVEDFHRIDSVQDSLEELMTRKTELLKQYQVANNPSEIDFDIMSSQTKLNIRQIEEQLQTIFKDLNSVLRKYDESEIEGSLIETENTVNESYLKALKDSKKDELDFILEHVTDNDKRNINEVERRIQRIKEGSDFIDKPTKRFLENYLAKGDMSVEDIRNAISGIDSKTLVIEFGKTRLLPYFKRFAPLGYDEFLNNLKGGQISVANFVKEAIDLDNGLRPKDGTILDYLSINTQFSWTEDELGLSYLNPNYNENFEGGIRQPKLDKYLNDSFFNEFGINKQNYMDRKELVATTKLKEFSMLEELWMLKKKGLEAYNELGSQNIYKLPQVSKGLVEKSKDFLTTSPNQTIGNSIRDIIYNRVDDLGYGERIEGEDVRDLSDIRLIPKYHLRDLEENSDLSNELAHSYANFLQASYVYKERLSTISDVMVLEQKLLESKLIGGKDTQSSNAYDMFKNFMDSYFFGIKRSRKFEITLPNGKSLDVSKIAIMFDRFVRYVNIGFSLPIAMTSLASAEIFLRIENHVGEYTNRESALWATKEFAKLTPKFMSEIGDINKESRLNQLGERFRMFELTERTTSSGFSKIIRASNNLPYKFSALANYPIAPRIMLTVLDDFRLVDGKFIDFNAFKSRNLGLTKEELIEKWKPYRESSMYNLLSETDGDIIDFPQSLKDELGEEYLESQISRIQGRVSRVNSNVDSVVPQEDKSAATRDFLMNFMTAHRGWLSIGIQRKFKRAHFNFATGQFEEGHYITLAKYFNKSMSLMREEGMKNFVKVFKENWHQLSDMEQKNVKRVLLELGVYMFLLGFGTIIATMADDDDNKDLWALQFSAYIYFRTVSEIGSVQAPTGVFGLVDTVQAPFIAINSIKDIMDVKGWSFDEVQSGAYEGHSKLYKKLAKQSWLRHWYDLQAIKQKSDYYRLLNSETLFHLGK